MRVSEGAGNDSPVGDMLWKPNHLLAAKFEKQTDFMYACRFLSDIKIQLNN